MGSSSIETVLGAGVPWDPLAKNPWDPLRLLVTRPKILGRAGYPVRINHQAPAMATLCACGVPKKCLGWFCQELHEVLWYTKDARQDFYETFIRIVSCHEKMYQHVKWHTFPKTNIITWTHPATDKETAIPFFFETFLLLGESPVPCPRWQPAV